MPQPAAPQEAWPPRPSPSPALAHAFSGMVDELRGFLDKVAGSGPDEATLAELSGDLRRWSERLGACQVPEHDQLYARLVDEPGRGQATVPNLVVEEMSYGNFRGHVTFGRFFLGVNGAAHGGVLPLVFDEVLGRTVARPGQRARTAYLNTNFRALTPLDTRLEVRGWVDRSEGRKHFARCELRHGDVVCAEGEGLFIALKPEQG